MGLTLYRSLQPGQAVASIRIHIRIRIRIRDLYS
jgi:hypothetical protein